MQCSHSTAEHGTALIPPLLTILSCLCRSPYTQVAMYAVIGKEEVEARTLSLTSRKAGDIGKKSLEEAIGLMSAAVDLNVEVHEVESGSGSGGSGGSVVVETTAAPVEGAAPSEGEILGGGSPALDEQYRKLYGGANGKKA